MTILIFNLKKTKTQSSIRVIRISDNFIQTLKHLRQQHVQRIFMNSESNIIPTSNAVNKSLRFALDELEINREQFHFHSLRYTHIAYLISQGVPIYAISKRFGHANISTTTDKYAYLSDEYKAKADDMI